MTDKKKPNAPELIEDKDLDEASGGGLQPTINPTAYKIDALKIDTRDPVQAWPSKIEIGSLKAGDGSV